MALLANCGETRLSGKKLALCEAFEVSVKDVAVNGGSTVFACMLDSLYTASTESSLDIYCALEVDAIFSTVLADCAYDFYWCDKASTPTSPSYAKYSDGTVAIAKLICAQSYLIRSKDGFCDPYSIFRLCFVNSTTIMG